MHWIWNQQCILLSTYPHTDASACAGREFFRGVGDILRDANSDLLWVPPGECQGKLHENRYVSETDPGIKCSVLKIMKYGFVDSAQYSNKFNLSIYF